MKNFGEYTSAWALLQGIDLRLWCVNRPFAGYVELAVENGGLSLMDVGKLRRWWNDFNQHPDDGDDTSVELSEKCIDSLR